MSVDAVTMSDNKKNVDRSPITFAPGLDIFQSLSEQLSSVLEKRKAKEAKNPRSLYNVLVQYWSDFKSKGMGWEVVYDCFVASGLRVGRRESFRSTWIDAGLSLGDNEAKAMDRVRRRRSKALKKSYRKKKADELEKKRPELEAEREKKRLERLAEQDRRRAAREAEQDRRWEEREDEKDKRREQREISRELRKEKREARKKEREEKRKRSTNQQSQNGLMTEKQAVTTPQQNINPESQDSSNIETQAISHLNSSTPPVNSTILTKNSRIS